MATKFAEVVYETGSHAVVSYENESELLEGLQEQNRRAINGEPGGPTGHAAERVKEVLLYDEHPGDYLLGGLVDSSTLKSDVTAMVEKVAIGNQASVWELISELRNYMTALKPRSELKSGHDSIYKMNETGTLTLSDVEGTQ